MNEQTLLIVLVVATTINTVILIILMIALLKLALSVNKLIAKADQTIDYVQRELLATVKVARKALQQGGKFLENVYPAVQRYMLMSTLKKMTSPRLSRIITGAGLGYGLVQSYLKMQQKQDRQPPDS